VPCTDIEAYCEVSCEGETLRSTTTKKTANPEWNMFAIFYRRQPLKKPIRVDVRLLSVVTLSQL